MSAYKQEVKKLASTIKQLAKSADGAYSDDVEKDLWLDAGVELGLITGYDAMKLNEVTEILKSKILKEAVAPKGVSWITIDYKPVSDKGKKEVLDFFKDAIKKSGLKISKSTNNFSDDILTNKGNIGYKIFEGSIHIEADNKIDFDKIKTIFKKDLKNLSSTLDNSKKIDNSEDLLKKFNWSKFKVLVNDRIDDEEDVDAADELNDFVDAFFINNTDREDAGSTFSEEFYMQSYKEAENIVKRMIKEAAKDMSSQLNESVTMKKKINLSKLLESISRQTGKKVILKEYFVNEKSKINDVGGLNILNDMDDEMLEQMGIESQKLIKKYQPIAKKLAGELKPYMKKPIPAEFVEKIDDSWYDGSDAYDDQNSQEKYLPKLYDSQIKIINQLITALKK